ncbi:MAG TPA: hypothetical protein VGV64_05255 [Thermoplasmata archaeon]|nr:hypothetical protein [Thermoplasmata archaeon]
MSEGIEWLRVRGMGRERFAGHLADFLESIGYSVERKEVPDPPESRLTARLTRQNPAVPEGAKSLEFRLSPTSGGASLTWVAPPEIEGADRGRVDRLVREIAAHLERSVLTESHATAKVSRAPDARLPWEPPR